MNNIDYMLNSIYCLSREASSTVTNLRLYPHIVKNSYSYKLYTLLEDLYVSTLEIFKDIKLDLLERDLNVILKKIVSKCCDIGEVYGIFILTANLPSDHILVKKLKSQINNLLLTLTKLSQITSTPKVFNHRSFIAE